MACCQRGLDSKGSRFSLSIPWDKNEARQFIDWGHQHFPLASIQLYSGKDWMTIISDQWSQGSPGLQGKPSILPLLDPLLDMTKPLHKLLLIGEAEESSPLSCYFSRWLPSTAFYLSKANYLEVTAKHVSKGMFGWTPQPLPLELKKSSPWGTTNDLPMLKSRHRCRYGQRSSRGERRSSSRDKGG